LPSTTFVSARSGRAAASTTSSSARCYSCRFQARDAVKPILATLLSLISATPDIAILAVAGIDPGEVRLFGELYAKGELPTRLVTDKMIDTFAIAGSPERCRAALAELVEAGIQHPVAFEIPGVSPDETLAGVHRYLMPHFL
jgi:alkanesulfonate monooxygenase SsuD/methylene tetrahydromethanopterin reductase-like flavin-dependent oxidoreductase (luciferase family)